MKPVVQRLLARLSSKQSRNSRHKNRYLGSSDRRLKVESLESRRVLAATIASFAPTPSGFTAELSEEVSIPQLSLYDTEAGDAGAADVTLQGATTGEVRGSLVVNGTTVTFIATDGPLAADTYTATLRSASDGFTDLADGELLDGDGDGTAGGNYVTTFTVASPAALVVGLPDIVRGPSQTVQLPVGGSGTELPAGLPIQLSNADGVTSVTLTIQYDPAMLDISGVQLGEDAPTGSQVEANLDTPGVATITFFSLEAMDAGQADIIDLIATIPEDAPYGSTGTLTISSLEVNAGGMTATADDAIQVVAFPGDVNANRRYDAEDARLVARVGVDLDTGFVITDATGSGEAFVPFAAIDPDLLGDVTGQDGLSPLDASDLLRRVVGLSTPNIPDLPDAQAPTSISLSTTTVAENLAVGTAVGTFSSTDPDSGDTHTYALVSGTGSTDNSSFTISGNTLVTAEVFDASVQDTYTIRVQTTDSTGRTLERVFTLTVTDQNVAPTAISLSDTSIAENETASTAVGDLSTTDSNTGDTFTYSIVSIDGSTTDTTFAISGNSLVATGSLDFETKSSYSVVVRTTDQGGLSFDQTFTINVADINEAPTAIALSDDSIADDSVSGTVVGSFTTTDVDASDSFTYSLVSGTGDTDNASFTIVGNELRTATTIDFDTQSSYSIRIQTTDSGGETFEQVFTIVQSNEGPTAITLSDSSVAENGSAGDTVGTFSSTDPTSGDTFTYTFATGEGDDNNALFAISGNELQAAGSLDAETQGTLTIRVRSTDSTGEFIEETFTITVSSVNEAPTTLTLSGTHVATGEASGTVVGTLGTDDPDVGDTITYTLVSGTGDTDNASFTISNGELITAFAANQSTQSSYSVRVQAQDADGLSTEETFTITITSTNVAPTAIAIDNNEVEENADVGATVGTLSTTDPNAVDSFIYTLVSGSGDTDNALFAIDGNDLVTATSLDFETQSSYSVRIQSTDPFGLSTVETFTITATDVNDAPTAIAIDNSSVSEDTASGTTVGAFSTTDADASDTFTYTLVSGDGDTDNAAFTIDGGNLVTATTFDFATQSSYSIRVQTEDSAGATFVQILTITITESEANVAPTAISIDNTDIEEHATVGTTVGTLSTTDANASDTFTYALVSGEGDTDNAAFTIDGSNLVTANSFDFETQSSYSIRVQTTDSGGATFEQTLTLSVTDSNDAPTSLALDNSTIAEDVASGTTVGELSTTDADAGDTFTYELVSGDGDTDNAAFSIDGSNLVTATTFDFDTQSSYSVRIKSTDSNGATITQVLTITITDTSVNAAPTAIAIDNSSLAEDAASGTTVGELSTTDADAGDTFSYALVSGDGDTDNAAFSIDGSNLVTATTFDFDTQSSYSVRIRTTDSAGANFEQALTITITETSTNAAPTAIAIDNSSIAEDAASGTIVGALSTTDADAGDTFTYALVAGDGDTDNAAFSIDGSNLVTATTFDFDTQSSYSVRVQTTDSAGATFEQSLTITITETSTNAAPTAIAIDNSSLAEDAASGTIVGALSTTDADAGDTFSYALVAGDGDTDNAAFSIDGSNLVTATTFDFDTQSSYSVRIRTTDSAGANFEQSLTITITETSTNAAPTAIAIDNTSVAEDAASGTIVGALSTTDADAGDTFTYALVAGDGDTDNAAFSIDGSNLVTATTFDFETQSSYSVRVQTTDSAGATFEQALTITVTNVNEDPTAISISSSVVTEESASGTTVGSFSTADVDASDTFTYTLVAGDGDTDNASFTLDGEDLLTATTLDMATQSSYSIRVRSTDAEGSFVEQTFTITVTDTNAAPTAIALDDTAVAENAAIGTVVGALSTTDADVADTFTYSLVSGVGDTDNGLFAIDGENLVTAATFDFESQSSYSVRIQSTDAVGATIGQSFLITVTDVNEAPTGLSLAFPAIASGQASGFLVGDLGAVDPDAGDTFTFEFVSGDGDLDNDKFTLVDGALRTAEATDDAIQALYSIRVRVTDSGGLTFEDTADLIVSEENVAPTGILLDNSTVADGSLSGTTVGNLSATDANDFDEHTFELVAGTGGTDNASFTIVDGVLQTNFDADESAQSSYSIRVLSTDRYGLAVEEVLTITIETTV
ncbi:cadherin domain-containing protein [Rhodopirellula sp. P2]|uniref:cadherin domain-containing protein n=1 Tax=Rhodopirellula sp. P2 TaxID=2127060 RepID=UPI002368180F|nr:cadherin domain-containing protein [Rhodopirellula sp. P2]WDQ16168.1 cadherin domain-containing protein [Rhodopirellula sp. P2]